MSRGTVFAENVKSEARGENSLSFYLSMIRKTNREETDTGVSKRGRTLKRRQTDRRERERVFLHHEKCEYRLLLALEPLLVAVCLYVGTRGGFCACGVCRPLLVLFPHSVFARDETMTTRVRQLINKLFGKSESRLLITGLDASGKTSILYRLRLGELVTTIPTIGFNVETVLYQNHSLTMWDVGGCDKIRPLLRHYLQGTQALIFVIDANDLERVETARDEFWRLLANEEVKNIPVLLYLNKTDLPGVKNASYFQEKFDLNALRGNPWHMQTCSVPKNEGLLEGLAWLVRVLESPASKRLPVEIPSSPLNSDEEKFVQWLAIDDEETTEEFVKKFSSRQPLDRPFDHRAFLRVIWSSLQVFGRRDAVKHIFDHIAFYTGEKNETLIYFWIQLVHYARETTKHSSDHFGEFLVRNPQLLNERELPLTYYREKTLFSDQAKSSVVLPDLKQLPSILVNTTTPSTASAVPPIEVDDDEEFLRQFETCTLTSWSHRTHLRMAWLYLTRCGRREGVKKIFDGIKKFIDQSEVSRKTTFHFTMTYFWIQMIDLAIASHPKGIDFDEFIRLNPQLMNGGLFLDYYKKETMLNNPRARAEFVLPDLKPLPTLVLSGNKNV